MHNIEFVLSDFFDMKKLKADLVFLNPSLPTHKKVDILNQCEPNLLKLLNHSYKLARNLIILLPSSIDI